MIDSSVVVCASAAVAVTIVASWTLPARARPSAMLLGGMVTLGIVSWASLVVLAAATLATFYAARAKRHQGPARLAAGALIASGYLWLLWRSGMSDPLLKVVLPLGMAYYVLRLLHYLIESDRRGFREHSLLDYACYQFLPASLPVGPINRFDDFLRDLRRRRWDPDQFARGCSRLLQGLVQVVLIGNFLLDFKLKPILEQAAAPWPVAALYVSTVLFWLNIYVLFSGYSSAAIGVGAMLGFTLPENFRLPYLARNIGEFWRRWHMTLSSWCRDYVYTPVLALWRRPLLASVSSMLVLGVWHETSLHYVIWGVYHGLGLGVWRRFQAVYEPVEDRLPMVARRAWTVAAHVLTLHFVMFSYPVANAIEHLVIGR